MKMMMIHNSRDVYSLTGMYFKARALRRANATPIPAEAKNITQNRHIVYTTASPGVMAAIVGEAISITVLKHENLCSITKLFMVM